ncbi:MAG: VOC family protein [Alphaproteobacteria bacterium]|nr:VOC family protein [Alphaproteobacteria bacterium]
MAITIEGLDHLVLTVKSIDATCAFYVRVLGMRRDDFAPARTALRFGRQKINLHQADMPIDPRVRHATPGSGDLCFVTKTPIADVVAHLKLEGVEITAGPGERAGAVGKLLSVYFYDPDENQIEVSNQIG